MEMISFIDLAKSRYSCRKYLTRAIEKDKIDRVLEAGRIAPSAANYQPWKIYVVENDTNRDKLWNVYKRDWIRSAPVLMVICGDHEKSWKRGDGKDHCDIDIGIITDHITLQATWEGLATCWICNFDKKLLHLPAHLEPSVILSLGYPADTVNVNRHDSQRKLLSDIVCWEF
ncbi:MAG: nitroreductase family protein [Bacteroidia bacterium]|nr:nitroreductase family protein [Bacteroidia bacterium]